MLWWIPAGLIILLVIAGLWLLLLPMFLLMALTAAVHFSLGIVFTGHRFQNFCKDVWTDETELLRQLNEEIGADSDRPSPLQSRLRCHREFSPSQGSGIRSWRSLFR